ncbi:ATP-binding protein [Peredibacter sp. HCB2-198]|uniref:PAS domain-containing sensor histidine kinase n=1 Tax=Peredibacter sp. HCB2-198 TaxID=3383025 RepID=UPI0038B454C7
MEKRSSQMSSVLENALDAVVAMNTDGLIIEWNHQAEIIFGWKREEVINQKMSETIIPHRYREAHEKGLKQFLITKQGPVINNRLELTALRKDGMEIPIELSVTYLADSQQTCFYAFLRDITERINFRRSLIENQKELQSALKNRDEFVSITSHELKNPLSVLAMKSQIFRRNLSKDEAGALTKENVEKFINHVDDQISKLTRLVEEMLDVSRIRTGKLMIEWSEFEMIGLVRDLLDKMREQFLLAHCGVPQLKANVKEILGTWDKLRIEQVLMNLFTNVIRYASGRPFEVGLDLIDSKVLIYVKDQGPGITEEKRDKIFDPFERASDPSEVKSLGLGLYISKKIIEAQDGKIWVESEAGKGSTFYVELPVLHRKPGTVEEIDIRQK